MAKQILQYTKLFSCGTNRALNTKKRYKNLEHEVSMSRISIYSFFSPQHSYNAQKRKNKLNENKAKLHNLNDSHQIFYFCSFFKYLFF